MTRTKPAVGRHVLQVQASASRHPQAGRVQQLQQRPVAEAQAVGVGRLAIVGRRVAGRLEQALDLVHGERLGQQPRLARQVEVRRDVRPDQPLAESEAVEAADRRRPAAEAGGREAGVAGRPRRARADR